MAQCRHGHWAGKDWWMVQEEKRIGGSAVV